MRTDNTAKIVKIIILGTALNIIGRFLAIFIDYPGYLDVTGSIYAAYYGGPLMGAIVAAVSCTLTALKVREDIYFIFSDVIFAIIASFFSKNNRYFNKLMSVFSMIVTFTIIRGLFNTFENVVIYDGRTGVLYPDSLMDLLNSAGFPSVLQTFIATQFICFTDLFFGMIAIYAIRKMYKLVIRKKNARKLKKVLGGRATLSMILLSVVLSISLTSQSKANDEVGETYVARVYNAENGLIGGCANDIVQTNDGIMWVGTYGGLYRFNGRDFTLLDIFDSVRSVQCLHVDKENRIWVGTNGAGLTVIDDNLNAKVFDASNGLPSNYVNGIVEDENNTIYISTNNGFVSVSYEDGDIQIDKTNKQVSNVSSIATYGKSTVAVLNSLGEIYVFDDGISSDYLETEVEGGTCLSFDNDGNLYVGTDCECIQTYQIGEDEITEFAKVETPGFININNLFFRSDGAIYASADSGIVVVTPSGSTIPITVSGFDGDVESIYEDYQGNMWFTSYRRGLLCLSHSSFSYLFSSYNAPEAVVNVATVSGNYMYVGTDDGVLIFDKENVAPVQNDVTEYFKDIRVRSITADAQGNIVILGYGQPIMAYTPDGRLIQYLQDDSEQINDRRLRVAYPLTDGTLAVSGDNGVYFIKDRKLVKKLEVGKELKSAKILNFIEAPDGTIFAGSDGDGIAVIKDFSVEKYIGKESGICSGVILRIVKDKQQEGYFIMSGSGICYMHEDYTVEELTGVPYYNNFDLYQNDSGDVFILGGAGIYVVRYDNFISNTVDSNYTLLDIKAGLPGSLTSNSWNYVDEDEYLYICGSTGIYKLDTKNYDMRIDEYKVKVTGITEDGKYSHVTNNDEIVIPRGIKRVELNIDLNNFTPTDPYIRYYLEGVDTEKTKVLSSNLGPISYYTMPYGSHRFHIEVLSSDNKVLSEQIYVITKEREIYETVGFRGYFFSVLLCMMVLVACSIINGAVFYITKKQNTEHDVIVRRLQEEKTEALEKSLQVEADANKMKSAFLANMSHEIRTPINAIIGMGTMITRESNEAETIKYAQDIRSASKTLLALINDILDFSKIESGNFQLVDGRYDLKLLINDLVNMMTPKANDKNLELVINVNENIPRYLYGDDVRIEQVIINILSNAVKYTQKGKVTFSLNYEKVIDVIENEIELRVTVSDTGIGIKPEELDKLFSPYQRIDEQRNKKVEGTGLGMSITKSILDKMNSQLEVSSVYGEGSTFAFSIIQKVEDWEPVGDYADMVMDSSMEEKLEDYHAPDAKILIVDDVEMNLIVAKNLLKRIKAQVDTASNGKDALDISITNKYDIILLDAMMPQMSGEETLREIRRLSTLNLTTPIIVLTANAVKGAKEEYLEAGFTDYLSKPIEGVELEATIRRYLPEEKILPVTDDERTDDEVIQEEDTFAAVFANIPEIQMQKGIEAAGDLETYKVVCKSFYESAPTRMGMIREYYDNKDIKNYTIQVHALKSSARLVGALDLSQRALELEMAGKENNVDVINANTEMILDIYDSLYKQMSEAFEVEKATDEEDSREMISQEQLSEAYSALKELVPMMEYDGVQMVLDEIDSYKLPEKDEAIFQELRKALKMFDWDKMEEILGL